MTRPPEIEQFADKLRLTLDRLSLSRVQLAQSAGVDKSVAARWASGRVHPGEQSIVRHRTRAPANNEFLPCRMEPALNRVCCAIGPAAPTDPRGSHLRIAGLRLCGGRYPGAVGAALRWVVALDAFLIHGAASHLCFSRRAAPRALQPQPRDRRPQL